MKALIRSIIIWAFPDLHFTSYVAIKDGEVVSTGRVQFHKAPWRILIPIIQARQLNLNDAPELGKYGIFVRENYVGDTFIYRFIEESNDQAK